MGRWMRRNDQKVCCLSVWLFVGGTLIALGQLTLCKNVRISLLMLKRRERHIASKASAEEGVLLAGRDHVMSTRVELGSESAIMKASKRLNSAPWGWASLAAKLIK